MISFLHPQHDSIYTSYRTWLYKITTPHCRYIIADIDVQEQVLEIKLIPKNSEFQFEIGQYAYFQFKNQNIASELHPFTLACSPQDFGEIKIAIKQLGDFTRSLSHLCLGDSVNIYGPYGNFADTFLADQKDCVCIGGGIGATIFIGMWQKAITDHMQHKTHLFYTVNTREEANLDNDFKNIALVNQFKGKADAEKQGHSYELFISQEQGFLTAEYIKNQIGSLQNKYIFLCGPVVMVMALLDQLKQLNVTEEDIILGDFNLSQLSASK
jgi:predicted ferric reductase